MPKRIRSWAEIKRSKVAEVRAYYFELTGHNESSPATKAGLIEEIEEILRERSVRTTALLRRTDTEQEAKARTSWREDNARRTAEINSVFADFPSLDPM